MDTGSIDVDGLFADDVLGDTQFGVPLVPDNVGLLPSRSLLPVGLVQHIFDLQHCGCSQRVAWSKQGCVAIVSPDSLHVTIKCLRYVKKDGYWSLSKSYDLFQNDYRFPISHAQWSPAGVDLAIADQAGRVGIFTFSSVAMNKLLEVRSASLDTPDEFGRAIALFWLNQERQREVVLQSSKDNSRWTHIMAKRKPLGPYFPRALAAINRKGVLCLIFQRPDRKWAEAATQVHQFESPEGYLTHAAFALTVENKLLVVTYTYDQKLSVFLVSLVWPDLRQDSSAEFVPAFEIEVVKSDVSNQTSYQSNDVSSIFPEEVYNLDMWGLTHLEVIPTSDIEKTPQLPPTIFAVYTSTDHSIDVTSPGFLSSSLIRRWTVHAVEQKLHPRFDDVAAKTSSGTTPKPKMEVSKVQPDMPFEHIITSFEQVDGGQSLAITTHDGATTFWRPENMTQSFLENEANEATSMSQSGFVFQINPYPLQIAFSPNACQCVSLDLEGTPRITGMQFHHSTPSAPISQADPQLDAALAAIILTFARACHSRANTDDLLACILQNFRPDQIALLLIHAYRSLFRDGEVIATEVPGSEVSHLHTRSMVAKVLSFHAALGFVPAPFTNNTNNSFATIPQQLLPLKTRNNPARLAWLTLHVRHSAILFYFVMSVAQGQAQTNTPYHRDFVDLLCAHTRWLMDLFKWMMDTLLDVGYRQENPGFFPERVSGDGKRNGNGDADSDLHLVTLLLTGVWSKHFLKLTMKLLMMIVSPPLGGPAGLFVRIAQVLDRHGRGQGLSTQGIERLLNFTTPHEGPVVGIDARARREAEMMATGTIPEAYQVAVERFREMVLPEMRNAGQFERLKLFECAAGLSWAGLEDEGFGEGAVVVDMHKKGRVKSADLAGEDSVRICVRCGGLSEDFVWSKDWSRVILMQMSKQMMRCVCEAGWLIEGGNGK